MVSRACTFLLLVLSSFTLEGVALRHPVSAQEAEWTGTIVGQQLWHEWSRSSSDSLTTDDGECNSHIDFFAYGWLRYRYTYYRVTSQTWSYADRRPNSTAYREDIRRTTYVSGRSTNSLAADSSAIPPPQPITDLIQ